MHLTWYLLPISCQRSIPLQFILRHWPVYGHDVRDAITRETSDFNVTFWGHHQRSPSNLLPSCEMWGSILVRVSKGRLHKRLVCYDATSVHSCLVFSQSENQGNVYILVVTMNLRFYFSLEQLMLLSCPNAKWTVRGLVWMNHDIVFARHYTKGVWGTKHWRMSFSTGDGDRFICYFQFNYCNPLLIFAYLTVVSCACCRFSWYRSNTKKNNIVAVVARSFGK